MDQCSGALDGKSRTGGPPEVKNWSQALILEILDSSQDSSIQGPEILDRSNGRLGPFNTYPALLNLRSNRFVTLKLSYDNIDVRGGRPRFYYTITAAGVTAYKKWRFHRMNQILLRDQARSVLLKSIIENGQTTANQLRQNLAWYRRPFIHWYLRSLYRDGMIHVFPPTEEQQNFTMTVHDLLKEELTRRNFRDSSNP